MTGAFDLEDTALARLVLSRGLLPVEELRRCLEEVRRRRPDGAGLATLLRERGLLSEAQIEETLAGRPAPPIEPLPAPARLGPYVLVRELARGGMGAVHEAVHEPTGTRYALKTIQPGGFSGGLAGNDLARFTAEAQLMARLDHPHVVRIHAASLDSVPPYLVQDLLTGGSLRERLDRAGSLPPAEAATLTAKLARGLEHAHRLGVLHRDLKPSNVLFDERGEPRLVDFGLARELDHEGRLTATGDILGTPGYLAPEQALGLKADDSRTDVYGLGGILYACLTGGPPVQPAASLMTTLRRVVEGRIVPVQQLAPGTPPALEAICLHALATDPEQRYASPAELAVALETGTSPSTAGAPRSRLWLALGALLVTLLVVISVARKDGSVASAPPAPTPTPVSTLTLASPAAADAVTAPAQIAAEAAEVAAASCRLIDVLAPLLLTPKPKLRSTLTQVKQEAATLSRADPAVRAVLAQLTLAGLNLRQHEIAQRVITTILQQADLDFPPYGGIQPSSATELRHGILAWARLSLRGARLPPTLAKAMIDIIALDPIVHGADLSVAETLSRSVPRVTSNFVQLAGVVLQAESQRRRSDLCRQVLSRAQHALTDPFEAEHLLLRRCLTSVGGLPLTLRDLELLAHYPDPQVEAAALTILALDRLRQQDRGGAGRLLLEARRVIQEPELPELWLAWARLHWAVGPPSKARRCADAYLRLAHERADRKADRLPFLPALRILWARSSQKPGRTAQLWAQLNIHASLLPRTWRLRHAWLATHRGRWMIAARLVLSSIRHAGFVLDRAETLLARERWTRLRARLVTIRGLLLQASPEGARRLLALAQLRLSRRGWPLPVGGR